MANKKMWEICWYLNNEYICGYRQFSTYENVKKVKEPTKIETFDSLVEIFKNADTHCNWWGIYHNRIKGDKEKGNRIIDFYIFNATEFYIKEKNFHKEDYVFSMEINEIKLSFNDLKDKSIEFALEYLQETQGDKIKEFLQTLLN